MAKTFLITGVSSGFGRALAEAALNDGHRVAGTVRNEADRKKFEAIGGGAQALILDVTDTAKIAPAVADIEQSIGAIDVLVNNAGISGNQPLGEIDEDTYRRVIEINLTAPLFLMQELAPAFRDGGRIVNISTGYTRVAAPTHPAYAATKGAINTLGLALAPTFGPRGITINAVMPGIIDTDMNADWLGDDEARAGAAAFSVFNRIGTVDDVAALVRYLASDAGRWTTGQVIDATGGSAL